MKRSMRSAPPLDSSDSLDRRWLDKTLRRVVPQLRVGAWKPITCQVTDVRARWSSQVIFCRLSYRERGAADPLSASLVIKVGPHVRDGVEGAALEALARAGMRSPSRYQVPHVLGTLSAEGVIAQREAPGESLRMLVARSDQASTLRATSAAEAVARWLTRFQSLPLTDFTDSPTTLRPANPEESLERLLADLHLVVPRHDPLAEVLDACAVLRMPPGRASTPSHGDFHPGQALVGPRLTTTVVDFEMFAWRDPGFDVGTCLAQLLAMAWFDTGDVRLGVEAARAFWLAYAREGRATWPEARQHAVRALLQVLRFALASPRADAPELRALWAWMIDSLLTSDTDESLWTRLALGARPALAGGLAGAAQVAPGAM